MALERWAIAQLDEGRALDDLLRQLLAGHTSISVLGIAGHLAVRARRISPATLALLSSFRLLRLDMRRVLKEREYDTAGLIGFDFGSADPAHRNAVAESSRIESRRLELRDLVPFFVLGGDLEMRDACRAALGDFPNRLEFAYQEEETDEEGLVELRRTAELWSELGHIENYVVEPILGRDDAVQISMNSPRHDTPEVHAVRQRNAELNAEAELWLWVDKCFTSQAWAPEFSPDEAVKRATELAESALVGISSRLMRSSAFAEGAVAGTAAAVICFADESGHLAWANDTIERFRVMQDESPDDLFPESSVVWHPKIFVAFALSQRIVSGGNLRGVKEDLFRLIAHPLHAISFAALAGVARCWERDERFAWCGLNLGLRLAQLVYTQRRYSPDASERMRLESQRRDAGLALTLDEYLANGPLPELVRPRASWVQAAVSQPVARGRASGWQRSTAIWDGRYAANVLKRVPVVRVMAGAGRELFVDALQSYVAWTLDAVSPSWREGSRESGDDMHYEWQDQLAQTIASTASHRDATEITERLLSRLLKK